MGIFGGLGGFFGNPDNLQLIGAGLKDIASPEESNLAKVTEMVRKRRASDDLMKAIQAQIGGGEAASIPTSVPQPGFNGIGPGEDGNPLAGPKLNGQRLPQPRMSVRSLLAPLASASLEGVDIAPTTGLIRGEEPEYGISDGATYTKDGDGIHWTGERPQTQREKTAEARAAEIERYNRDRADLDRRRLDILESHYGNQDKAAQARVGVAQGQLGVARDREGRQGAKGSATTGAPWKKYGGS